MGHFIISHDINKIYEIDGIGSEIFSSANKLVLIDKIVILALYWTHPRIKFQKKKWKKTLPDLSYTAQKRKVLYCPFQRTICSRWQRIQFIG